MIYVSSPHGPGAVGLSCGELARYVEFHTCFNHLQIPEGAVEVYGIGYDTASNSNDIIRQMRPQDEWVWIMDDDHTFNTDVLLRLLDRQVDCVVPLYMQRKPPFWPVAYKERLPTGACTHVTFDELAGKSGLLPIVSAGKAGVLIRRPVLAKLAGGECGCPHEDGAKRAHADDCAWATHAWFEHKGQVGEDHVFFDKVLQAGCALHVDLDTTLEHITPFKVRPFRSPEGEWCAEVHLYNEVNVKLWVHTPPAGG